MTVVGAAILLTLAALSFTPECLAVGCRSDPRVIGKCFQVHGRLNFANGSPMLRMWRVGTRRYLGVFDEEDPIVPPNLAKCLLHPNGTGFGRTTCGDFVVCPFTPQRPGWMQMVCIESAKNLVVQDVVDGQPPYLGPPHRCEAHGLGSHP